MTSEWSLAALFADFHEKIQSELATARKLGHPTDKGDASEQVWIDVLTHYLPRRYEARKGFVVDSRGVFSQQIDVIIHDRQYSPFVRSEEHTSELQSLMRISYAVFCLKKKN